MNALLQSRRLLHCPLVGKHSPFLASCVKLSSSSHHSPTWITKQNAGELVQKYDTFLLDCDGVLWAADHFTKFPSTAGTMDLLGKLGKRSLFVSNNSIPTRSDFLNKFQHLGGFEADISDVYSVAYVAGLYLKNIARITGKCYIMGSEGMRDEFDELGIAHIGYGPDTDLVSLHPDDLMRQRFEAGVEAVAIGFDIHFSYNKIYKAASYLEDPACHCVATNDKETYIILAEGRRQPLTRIMVESVSSTTGREPLVIGKPHGHLLECIHADRPGLDLSRAVMVGDSLSTDIKFANNAGIESILVLSGATRREELARLDYSHPETPRPTYVMDSFADLHKLM